MSSVSPEDVDRSIERLQSLRVMIATPMSRNPVRQYATSLAQTLMRLDKGNLKFQTNCKGGSADLSYTRNVMAAEFLESDCTDLVWIDDDIGWDFLDFLKLLMCEYDVVGGAYRRRIVSPNEDVRSWAFKPKDHLIVDSAGRVLVENLGTGFLKISRRALEKIVAAYPEIRKPNVTTETFMGKRIEPDNVYRFFCFDGFGGSEDYHFCDLWKSVGGEVWMDPSISLVHVGDYQYEGDVMAMLDAHKVLRGLSHELL